MWPSILHIGPCYQSIVDSHTVPCVDILIQPDGDPGPVLEVPEDEVDGLDHHLLNLLAATVAHLFSQAGRSEREQGNN